MDIENGLEPELANPFLGTWVHENGVTWAFTETTLVRKTPAGDPWIVGTYTFNDTYITITVDPEQSAPGLLSLIIEHRWIIVGDTLFVDGVPLIYRKDDE